MNSIDTEMLSAVTDDCVKVIQQVSNSFCFQCF